MFEKYRLNAVNKKSGRMKKNTSHAGLWMFTIFLFAIFTLGLVFLGKEDKINKMRKNYTVTNAEENLKANIHTQTLNSPTISLQQQQQASHLHTAELAHNMEQIQQQITLHEKDTRNSMQNNKPSSNHKVVVNTNNNFDNNSNSHNDEIADKIALASAKEQSNIEKNQQMQLNNNLQSNVKVINNNNATDNRANNANVALPDLKTSPHNMFEIKNLQKPENTIKVISTQNQHEAEIMRAKLALLGIESKISANNIGNKVYYQIILGPYNNYATLQKINKFMQKNMRLHK